MAREMADTLEAMRKESPAPRVFLADTSPARQSAAEDIKSWLVQHQVLVLRAAPWDGDWEKESRELIRQADLFVDLHEGAPHAPAVVQAQLAKTFGKQRMRWLPRGELAADAAQALVNETQAIEETLEDFKEALYRQLTQPGERHKPAAPVVAGTADTIASELVLLIAAQKDEGCLTPLEQKLDEIGCGRDAFVSEDLIQNPDNWRKELQALLELHRPASVVFVDGACEGPWADKRLRDLVLLLRDAAPHAKPALCTFPPPNKLRRYRPPAAQVVRLDATQLDRLKELL